jgi:DNA-binding GntR family transcriptional regulator
MARYVEIANEFRRRIANGTYVAGERLPSHTALAEAFDVSPVSIARAFRLVKRDGLIYTNHLGTFVTARPTAI